MRKTQVIITVLAVAICTLLAFAPKYVVENDAEANIASGTSEGDTEIVERSHSAIPEDVQQKLAILKNQLSTSDKEEIASLTLDSLVSIFKEVNAFDSAAYYAAVTAEKFPSAKSHIHAGDLYYEAYTYAVTEQRTSLFTNKLREQYTLAETFGELPEDVRVKLGMTYVSSENPMKGITMIREVLRENPDNTTAIFNLGLLSMQSGQFDKAVERFKKLKLLQPDNLQARFYLGVSYMENGEEQNAKKELLELKEKETDPNILKTVEDYLSRIQ